MRLILLVMIFAPAKGAMAQVDSSEYMRQRCAIAEGNVQSGDRAERRIGMLELQACPLQAALVAAEWERVRADTAELGPLLATTRRVHDRRILGAMLDAARSPERAPMIRVAAVIAMASYVDPRHTAYVRAAPSVIDGFIGHGVTTSAYTLIGPQAPTAGDRQRILRAWRTLEADPDRSIRSAAKLMLATFSH